MSVSPFHFFHSLFSSLTAKQHFLAVSDCLGVVRVFEIPKKLYIPSRNEVRQFEKLLCPQSTRELRCL